MAGGSNRNPARSPPEPSFMSKKPKRTPYSGPIVGEDIPPPPLWKLLLTAILVLIPTLWIGLFLFGGPSPRSDVVRTVTRASDALLGYVQEHNRWPESMQDVVPEEYQAHAGTPLVYTPVKGLLTLKLKEPLLLPSFFYRFSFGLLGTQQQWDAVEVDLVQRLNMMRLDSPPLPKAPDTKENEDSSPPQEATP